MKKAIRIINYICVVLMVAVLVMQFMPFWVCSGCKSHKDEARWVSVAEYTWLPEHHRTITRNMTGVYQAEYGEDYVDDNGKKYQFAVDDIITPCAVVLVTGVIGVLLCSILAKKAFVTWLPLICGVVGAVAYATLPAMKIGYNHNVHLLLTAALALVALPGVVIGVINWIKTKGHNYRFPFIKK